MTWEDFHTPFGESLLHPVQFLEQKMHSATDDQGDFTGHIRDSGSGLTYMQARYYDAIAGRFLSVDPVTFMDTGEPNFFNRYTYTFNDPINLIDPTGMAPGDRFASIEEAAKDWADYVQSDDSVDRDGNSLNLDNAEYASIISQNVDDVGDISFSYNEPRSHPEEKDNAAFSGTTKQQKNAVGSIHNHNGGKKLNLLPMQ